jgi:outer membrane lipoprotein-sorting protein
MNKQHLAACFLFFVFSCTAVCQINAPPTESPDRLDSLVDTLNSHDAYELTFKQLNQHVATGQKLEAEGRLRIQKPDRFEWIYATGSKNRITCDGHHILMLMPDTQQAMIETSDQQAVIWSPLSILTPSNLKTHFRVALLETSNRLSRYRLHPLRDDQPYEYLETIVYENSPDRLFSLIIMDLAGSVNTLDFGHPSVPEEKNLIVLPSIPETYDVTDFYGNPQNFRIL